MTNPTESLIERFYAALASRDGEGMAACYAPDVRFSDPVFSNLRGSRAGAMWRMLCEQGKDLQVELLEREADGERGSARWRALRLPRRRRRAQDAMRKRSSSR